MATSSERSFGFEDMPRRLSKPRATAIRAPRRPRYDAGCYRSEQVTGFDTTDGRAAHVTIW
jgi:hypothetical protein